jgi:hypothetical protein
MAPVTDQHRRLRSTPGPADIPPIRDYEQVNNAVHDLNFLLDDDDDIIFDKPKKRRFFSRKPKDDMLGPPMPELNGTNHKTRHPHRVRIVVQTALAFLAGGLGLFISVMQAVNSSTQMEIVYSLRWMHVSNALLFILGLAIFLVIDMKFRDPGTSRT